jgi:hypothetical protein
MIDLPRRALARRRLLPVLGLVALLSMLAMARPVDHDESQYVAAAVLVGEGLLPYRDFAYLQTPLQPLLFGPLAEWLTTAAYPGLRFVNALLGALAVLFVFRASVAGGAGQHIALAAAGLFAGTDVLLFGTGIARNDALPAAMLAGAVWAIVASEGASRTRARAELIGLLLAGAACAKASYALPAAAYGAWALAHRDHRPGWVAAGALLPVALLAWVAAQAPDAFWFEVFTFPAEAPRQYYEGGRAYKLTLPVRVLETLLYLGLGAALPAAITVARATFKQRKAASLDRVLELLIVAGLTAAILPEPTWRQYLLPMLPPLFVRLARLWARSPPARWERIVFASFVAAGLAPTGIALARAARDGLPMARAIADGEAIGRALDDAGVTGEIATLSPQFLPGAGRLPDPRFAAGPFYFRSSGLISDADERRFHLVSADRLAAERLPPLVLLGGEAAWSAGNPALDAALERVAAPDAIGVLRISGGRFRILIRDPQAARRRASSSPE